MAEDGHKVSLNVYDLSQGLARQLSTTFLGKAIEGIWHTGVVVYGNEYYFGGGIQHSPAGRTPYGTPVRVVDLGITHVPKELFEEYLQEISPRYTEGTYSILGHNCNNFSNEVIQFLVGATIPEYILQLPNEVVNSPMGALILPMIQQLETTLRSGAVPLVPQFRPQSLAQPSQPMSTTRMDSNQYTVSTPNMNAIDTSTNNACVESNDQSSKDTHNMPEKLPNSDKTVAPAGAQEKVVNGISGDTLEDARSKVQEEITREFAAIMATGTLRASEAAALATRRVMEKHGRMNVAMQ